MSQYESEATTPHPLAPYGPGRRRRRNEAATLIAVVAAMILTVGVGAVAAIQLAGSDPSAETVVGDGYSYVTPVGWTQVTPPDESMDTLASAGTAEKILVAIKPARSPIETPGDLWTLYSAMHLEGADELPAAPRGPRLDGEPTVKGHTELGTSRLSATSRPFYIAEHDGRLYSIVVTAPPGGAAEADAVLRDVAASWSWG